jgi:hypothetical protein
MSNRDLVLKAISDVFINRDITAFDKYFMKITYSIIRICLTAHQFKTII